MANIRFLSPLDQRAETGPMQFGLDWPGVFIRGDNALAFAAALEADQKGTIIELIALLRSCSAQETGN